MMPKKNRAVVRIPSNAILNCDDRKKFSAIVALFVQVNKRINPEEYAAPARTRSKKTKKIDIGKSCRDGSQIREPLLFLIIDTLLCILNYFKINSIGKAYDRYHFLLLPQDSFQIIEPGKFLPSTVAKAMAGTAGMNSAGGVDGCKKNGR